MESRKTINIDFDHLSEDDATLLHQFLIDCEKKKKPKIFEPGQNYSFKDRDFVFSHKLVRRTKKHPDGKKEYIYTVYKETDQSLKGSGSFGKVYEVLGKLKHFNNKLIYKPIDLAKQKKRKVIKKILLKQFLQEKGTTPAEAKMENKFDMAVVYTKAKKITFEKDSTGRKIAAYTVKREFPGKLLKDVVDANTTVAQLMQLSLNLLLAVKELHEKYGIIHRDLKPENIFVDPNDNMAVYIYDFGLSRPIDKPDYQFVGTMGWCSPELIHRQENCDETSDVFSIGMILRYIWADQEIFAALEELKKVSPSKLNIKAAPHVMGLFGSSISHPGQVSEFHPPDDLDTKLSTFGKEFFADLEDCLNGLTLFNQEQRFTLDAAIKTFVVLCEQADKNVSRQASVKSWIGSLDVYQEKRNKKYKTTDAIKKTAAPIGNFFSGETRYTPGEPRQKYISELKEDLKKFAEKGDTITQYELTMKLRQGMLLFKPRTGKDEDQSLKSYLERIESELNPKKK